MILTCPKCQSQYKLDPTALGVAGRDVRCVTCSHTWFQIPETAGTEEPKPSVTAEPKHDSAAQSVTDALNTILEKDDAAFEAVLSTVAKGAKGSAQKAAAAEPAPAVLHEDKLESRWQIIRQESELPVVMHDPMGLGATVFGALVFLFYTFLTLTILFMARGPVVHHWPQMSLLYRKLGFDVKAPGEGLRLSELTAEKRIDSQGKILVVEGKMTNMSEHDIAYPPLHVTLKNDKNVVTREWDLKTGVTQIASGDVVPVMVQLHDIPDDSTTVEVRVKEK